MTLFVGRDLERGKVWVHQVLPEVGVSLTLTEAEAVELADQLVSMVDALNLERVLDEC